MRYLTGMIAGMILALCEGCVSTGSGYVLSSQDVIVGAPHAGEAHVSIVIPDRNDESLESFEINGFIATDEDGNQCRMTSVRTYPIKGGTRVAMTIATSIRASYLHTEFRLRIGLGGGRPRQYSVSFSCRWDLHQEQWEVESDGIVSNRTD